MASASTKKTSPIIYILGIGGLLAVIYVYTSGDDSTPAVKPPAANKSTTSTTADAYLPIDYKASYPPLQIVAKNAFLPLIRKEAPGIDNGKGSLPTDITGGGSWSYDGMVSVDNHVQGLLDETKTGESDFVSVGQHWKHGRIKRITDASIEIAGDDGTSASLKVGEPTEKDEVKAAPAVTPVQVFPQQLTGPIGGVDVNALPPANNGGGWPGGGRNRGFGGGRRGRGGGGMGFGNFGG